MNRDREVRAIAAELESLLDQLHANVSALNTILNPSEDSTGRAPAEEVPD